ncbi:hypothetical protein DPMN_172149 [Dreissena polymorpha]|uniref:Uncharacterized protein n=1 Tax=Dreissena polymorpha TaxID=45954 RepID=A0A9D4E319_DREPO|nr:hypothetical protein DPMN_172149 [Dreissena polymorpha]
MTGKEALVNGNGSLFIKLKLKSKRITKNPHVRLDLEKWKDPVIAEVFQAHIGGKKP